MRFLTIVFGVATTVGTLIAVGTGYLIVRGPFLGGPTLAPERLMLALGGFVVGIIVLTWGGSKLAGV